MREIKFRVKRQDDKTGGPNADGWEYFVIKPKKNEELKTISFGSNIHFYLLEKNMIDNSTWCEYTGLKDKNGVEIYEGDIIKWRIKDKPRNPWKYSVVCWEKEWACFLVSGYAIEDVLNGGGEVIGNIYENKNLLEDS